MHLRKVSDTLVKLILLLIINYYIDQSALVFFRARKTSAFSLNISKFYFSPFLAGTVEPFTIPLQRVVVKSTLVAR